jgi:hypothetical protein
VTGCASTAAPSAGPTAWVTWWRCEGPDGQPPFLVRFDDGQERLVFPGPDCEVHPAAES